VNAVPAATYEPPRWLSSDDHGFLVVHLRTPPRLMSSPQARMLLSKLRDTFVVSYRRRIQLAYSGGDPSLCVCQCSRDCCSRFQPFLTTCFPTRRRETPRDDWDKSEQPPPRRGNVERQPSTADRGDPVIAYLWEVYQRTPVKADSREAKLALGIGKRQQGGRQGSVAQEVSI
jgi:hypothetical protein